MIITRLLKKKKKKRCSEPRLRSARRKPLRHGLSDRAIDDDGGPRHGSDGGRKRRERSRGQGPPPCFVSFRLVPRLLPSRSRGGGGGLTWEGASAATQAPAVFPRRRRPCSLRLRSRRRRRRRLTVEAAGRTGPLQLHCSLNLSFWSIRLNSV